MRQSACLMINPDTVNNFASFFNSMPVVRVSDSVMDQQKASYLSWLELDLVLSAAFHSGFNL